MRAFTQANRFFSELVSRQLKPAYVLVGDEAFFRRRCRDAILEHLVAPDSRDFGLFEFDLAETSLKIPVRRKSERSLRHCRNSLAVGQFVFVLHRALLPQ